jgi:hypothetical protein
MLMLNDGATSNYFHINQMLLSAMIWHRTVHQPSTL